MSQILKRLGAIVLLAMVLLATIIAWHSTMRSPVVRVFQLETTALSAGSGPIRIILLSDIHVAGPDMPPSRLRAIVDRINTLKPDVVLLAGDVVSDKRTATKLYTTRQSIKPLARLKARIAKIAVPGNHDHWRGIAEVRQEMTEAGFTVLQNRAIQLGPVAIGGLDDDFTGHADLIGTLTEIEALHGPQIILSHSPDPFAQLPAGNRLMLAGHTHCGQIRFPWGGTPATMSRYGDRYACGIVRENGNTLVVTAGIGTSVLPLRFLAPPDIWNVRLSSGDGHFAN